MSQHTQPTPQPTPYSAQATLSRARSATQRFAVTLLRRLPSSSEEAAQRVAPLGVERIREALISMIERGELSAWEGDRLSPLFKVIGLGDQAGRLSALIKPERGERLRAQALAALFHSDEGQLAFGRLTDAERVELCAPWVRPMMALAREDRFPRFALAALYDSTPPAHRAALLERFERCRHEVDGCPQSAYELLLTRLELSLEELKILFKLLSQRGHLEALGAVISEAPLQLRRAYHRALSEVRKEKAS